MKTIPLWIVLILLGLSFVGGYYLSSLGNENLELIYLITGVILIGIGLLLYFKERRKEPQYAHVRDISIS